MTHPPATCELCGDTGVYSPSALPCPNGCKDVVERLLSYAKDQGGWHNIDDTCEEAADLIERQRQALSKVEQSEKEARAKALEAAANTAKTWLEDWGIDLQSTSDEYREAVISGKHNGRGINPDMAKTFARQFKERPDAVYDCGEQVAAAIRALQSEVC